jgi:hypothetical protein
MTASMVLHVTNLTPPGSEQPYARAGGHGDGGGGGRGGGRAGQHDGGVGHAVGGCTTSIQLTPIASKRLVPTLATA